MNAHPIWYFTAHPLGYGDHKLDGWGFRTEAELRAAGAQTIYHSPEALGKALLDGSIQ